MTTLLASKLTFEDYLVYDNGTDNQYELEDGALILMNPPIGLHALIMALQNSVWCFNHRGDWLMNVKNLRAISAASFSCEEMLCFSISVLSNVYALMAVSSRML